MQSENIVKNFSLKNYLREFSLQSEQSLFLDENKRKTIIENIEIENKQYLRFINEFWSSKQRQVLPLHEISYRACFKAQLPRFFIEILTKPKDIVYDPFSGRGTTIIESALLNRNIILNDINPLSKILCLPRLNPPEFLETEKRLSEIHFDKNLKADIELSMFYHKETESDIVSLRKYFLTKVKEDNVDSWIRMVATNRLTGHSNGFFSVYTLPPNQAISQEKQKMINEKYNQVPEYRDIKNLILKKSKNLLKNISLQTKEQLLEISKQAVFLTKDARDTNEIKAETVQLTVTSPPFLDVVNYAGDNWLRAWFNGINVDDVASKITVSKTIKEWCLVMEDVFKELYRITKKGGWVAFEVGEVRNGTIKLDEFVVPLGIKTGFKCETILINEQNFTKTANIWGVKNNILGTNTNRIVLFKKD